MKYGKIFCSALLAGVCIALGGTVYLSLESRLAGAIFFTVGLFVICLFRLHLFTGKVCYAPENGPGYALELAVVWLGNLAGTFLTAQGLRLTRMGPALAERAGELCRTKLDDSLLSLFLLAVFCNILIYIAVEGFNRAPHDLGRYLALFLGVSVFVLCGFEHCVADLYYFSVASLWSGRALGRLLLITLGNAVGGVLFPLLRRVAADKKEGAAV